jgi:hypothetical protein
MAAMRVDREDIWAGAHQQNFLVADMTEQDLAGEFGQVDAQRQIRTGGRGLFISHNFPSQIENCLVRWDNDRTLR